MNGGKGPYRFVLIVLAIGLLAGCGGGSSGGSTPLSTQAPTFTSASSASVVENTTGSIYQATATEPGNPSITYSITGGLDAGKFTITPGGQLSFVAAPNFDLPGNANGDNVYLVQITATDGRLSSVLSLAITVINSKEGIAVHRVGTGFNNPVGTAPISDTAVLVAEKGGAIYTLNPQTGVKTLLVQITYNGAVGVGGDSLIAVAVSPTFATDNFYYLMYTTPNGYLAVGRFYKNPFGPSSDASTFIFGGVSPQYQGGGSLTFDASGSLLAATSDAGGTSDPTGSAQDPASIFGKIIRITPNPDPYAGASINYFTIAIVADGLHQPNGGSVLGGSVIFADHGQDVAEELDLLPPGTGLTNFGWPYKEGTQVVHGTPPAGLTDPVAQYFRGTGPRAGQAIIGGAMGPTAIASLKNQYVFGDNDGAIFTVNAATIMQGTTLAAATFERRDADFAPDQGTISHPVAITGGPNGTLYIVDADGDIFRVDAG